MKYTYEELSKFISSFSWTPLFLSPRDKLAAGQTLPAKLDLKKFFKSLSVFWKCLVLQIYNGNNQQLKYQNTSTDTTNSYKKNCSLKCDILGKRYQMTFEPVGAFFYTERLENHFFECQHTAYVKRAHIGTLNYKSRPENGKKH